MKQKIKARPTTVEGKPAVLYLATQQVVVCRDADEVQRKINKANGVRREKLPAKGPQGPA